MLRPPPRVAHASMPGPIFALTQLDNCTPDVCQKDKMTDNLVSAQFVTKVNQELKSWTKLLQRENSILFEFSLKILLQSLYQI